MSNLSVYLYDDDGERAWELTGEEMQVQVNGQTMYSSVISDKTLYASPFLVMDEHEYTKHYYIEGERVCSKIGSGFGPATVLPTSTPLSFIVGDESDCAENLKHLVYNHLECTDYNGHKKIYVDLQQAYNTNNDFEDKQYFYHPDHLGSSSFITNALGKAEQHMQYLPFGELWINQRTSEFDSPYKFSAKELDSESGYNYFGARYYDSELSTFLSVDGFSDKYPTLTPYHYAANNPLFYLDPTGDTIVVNKYGTITRNDETDNLVYFQDGDRFEHIGEVGDNIVVDEIMENLLSVNSEQAKQLDIWGFKEAVQQDSDWDYKNDYNTETGEGSIFGYAWNYDIGKEDKTKFSFSGYSGMTAADIGNYHFGYVGRYTYGGKGMSKYILWKGAGFAETQKEFNEGSKFKGIFRAADLLNPMSITSGDRVKDFRYSTKGMNDANKIKRR